MIVDVQLTNRFCFTLFTSRGLCGFVIIPSRSRWRTIRSRRSLTSPANYIDRLSGSFVGIYESTVTDQFVDYVRPQDNGYKCDVRWAEFMDGDGRGVRFSADTPLFMQALHYSWDDLNYSRHQNGQVQFRTPLVKRAEVMLNLDVRQLGLGGSSCGPGPLAKYIFDPLEPVAWTMKLEPVLPARKSRP